MLGARPKFDGASGVVAFVHAPIANAKAFVAVARPAMTRNVTIVFVCHKRPDGAPLIYGVPVEYGYRHFLPANCGQNPS